MTTRKGETYTQSIMLERRERYGDLRSRVFGRVMVSVNVLVWDAVLLKYGVWNGSVGTLLAWVVFGWASWSVLTMLLMLVVKWESLKRQLINIEYVPQNEVIGGR